MKWIECKSELENAINNGKSYESIGRRYNVSGSYIRKICSKIGITLPHRRKINPKETFNKGKCKTKICKNCNKEFISFYKNSMFCCTDCANEYKKKKNYQYYLENQDKYNGRLNMLWIKPHILQEQNCKCAICGIDNMWNNKPLIFILDHIDGRAKNNMRDNLRLICPNCDSQLDTYKSKNKNSDRIYYKFYHR